MTDIKGFENEYAITEDGQVWSYKRKKFLKLHTDRDGYVLVSLCKNSKVKDYRVHRLVAKAFLANPDNLPEVNHIDENKENNSVKNLEWCSRQYNNTFGKQCKAARSERMKAVWTPEMRERQSRLTVEKLKSKYATT